MEIIKKISFLKKKFLLLTLVLFCRCVTTLRRERKRKSFDAAFAAICGNWFSEQRRVGIVHLSVSDILIHFSVSVPQTYLTADSWHHRSGKGGVTADAAFINT